MRSIAVVAVCIVCFLAGTGVGAGTAWMIAGANTVGLPDAERTLIEQTSYAEGWTDGYQARRKEQRESNDQPVGDAGPADDDDSESSGTSGAGD